MENTPNFPTPVQKQLKENLIDKVRVHHFLEILRKYLIRRENNTEDPLKQDCVITLQNSNDTHVKVTVPKIRGKLATAALHHLEVGLDQIQTLQNSVYFRQTSFGKDQQHEGVEQSAVGHQPPIEMHHLLADGFSIFKLPHEDREERVIVGEVLPQDTTVVVQQHLGLVPKTLV
jgi:hypothetical protein